MKIKDLKERSDIDRCSASMCRHPSEVILRPGATPANPKLCLSLCDAHWEEFNLLRESKHQGDTEAPTSLPRSERSCPWCKEEAKWIGGSLGERHYQCQSCEGEIIVVRCEGG